MQTTRLVNWTAVVAPLLLLLRIAAAQELAPTRSDEGLCLAGLEPWSFNVPEEPVRLPLPGSTLRPDKCFGRVPLSFERNEGQTDRWQGSSHAVPGISSSSRILRR
jgi:hypothetical protein